MLHEALDHVSVWSKERVIRRALYLFLAGLIILCTFPATLPAQAKQAAKPNPSTIIDSDQKYAQLPDKIRLKILLKMIRSGRHEFAARLIAAYPFSGRRARNRTLFVEGMILKARGDLDGAIGKFRSVLADDPNLSLVRMELAHTLFLAERDDSAKHHLELLRASAPTTNAAKQFDRFIDAIDARDPWTFDAYVSLAPSTNFNNGTSKQTIILNGLPFQISANSQEKSGIGVRGGANGSYTLRAGKTVDLIASAGINFTEYDGNTFDDLVFSQSLSVQKRIDVGTVVASIITNQRWSGIDEFSWAIGPKIALRKQIAPKIELYSNLRHAIIDYRIADYRSGHITSVEHRLSYGVADGSIAYLIGGAQRSESERNFNDYWGASAGLGLYHEAPYGITVYAEAELHQSWHDGVYPIINEARKDTRIDVDLSLTKRDFEIFGVTPQFQYSYIRNFSNSPLDRYESHGANLTLTKQF